MELEHSRPPGVEVLRPESVRDARGSFSRTFDADVARRAGVNPDRFVRGSASGSTYGVIRGPHVRVGSGGGSLVRCSHGFQAPTEVADTSYRIDRRHDPRKDPTIARDDPELGVAWPLPPGMSEGDRSAPRLGELTDRLSQIRPDAGAAG